MCKIYIWSRIWNYFSFLDIKIPVITNNLKHLFMEKQLLAVHLLTMKIIWINHIRNHWLELYCFAAFDLLWLHLISFGKWKFKRNLKKEQLSIIRVYRLIHKISFRKTLCWLCVLIMSHTRFRVNLHSVVAWVSRNF